MEGNRSVNGKVCCVGGWVGGRGVGASYIVIVEGVIVHYCRIIIISDRVGDCVAIWDIMV